MPTSDTHSTALASVDIGSNAVRLMFADAVLEDGRLRIIDERITRLPVRIGSDVFATGNISRQTRDRLTLAMEAFALLMKVHRAEQYIACATSALREAKNRQQVINHVRRKTGIDILCISGQDEARFLYHSLLASNPPQAAHYLHTDVGGGSTELILGSAKEQKVLALGSFRVGSVRKLKRKCTREERRMHQWIERHMESHPHALLTASGGNARRLLKMRAHMEESFIRLGDLTRSHQRMCNMSVQERIARLGLRPDRADTIVPAAEIYLNIMHRTAHRRIYVPDMNLASGLLLSLW